MTERQRTLWIGTYPAAGAGSPVGRGEGIWRLELDPATGELGSPVLAAATPAPSFLTMDRVSAVLYAVGEDADGTVTAFRKTGGGDGDGSAEGETLTRLNTVPSGGADPCHLLLDRDTQVLYASNYSSGTLAVCRIGADGLVGDGPVQVFGHSGSGPVVDRQEAPHAHSAALTPGGEFLVVADLGTDELRRYRRDRRTGLLTEDGIAATFAPGAGPRHLTFSADGERAYVVCELDLTVAVLAWDSATATGTVIQRVPAVDPRTQSNADADALPSHIQRQGSRQVVVATRGPNVLATLVADSKGELTMAGQLTLPGGWPRHFALTDGLVVVADQTDGAVIALRDGVVTSRVALPAAACILPE